MSELKEIILMSGEQVELTIEGDAYNDSPNPIAKLYGKITKLFGKIFGVSKKVYFVKTNSRLMLVEKNVLFWIFPRDTIINTLSYNSIDVVGYQQARRWFLFSSLYFVLGLRNGMTYNVLYKGSVEELAEVTQKMNASLYSSHSTHIREVA